MLRQPTLDRLRELRLRGMADAFAVQMESADAVNLTFEERLGLLVDAEWTHRRNTTLARLLREARLRMAACPEDVEFGAARGLDRSVWRGLFAGDFAMHHQNVLIIGATGVGKTYLACALGHACCRLGMRVRYLRLSQLLEEIALARVDGTCGTLLARISRADLLILDDFGLSPLSAAEEQELARIQADVSRKLGAAGRADLRVYLDSSFVGFHVIDIPGVTPLEILRLAQLNGRLERRGACRCAIVAVPASDSGSSPGT